MGAHRNYNELMKVIDLNSVKHSKSLLKDYCPNCESADYAGKPLSTG